MDGGDDPTTDSPATDDLAGDTRTVDPVAPGAPGGGPSDRGEGEVDPWTTRCEVLAVLALFVLVGSIAQNVLYGLHFAGLDEATGFSWSMFTATVASIGLGPGPALLLTVALALVVLSPGPSIGAWGSGALQGVAVLGVLVATTAVVGVVEVLRVGGDERDQLVFVPADSRWLEQAGAIATFVPVGVLAAGAALFAWRTLGEVAPVSR